MLLRIIASILPIISDDLLVQILSELKVSASLRQFRAKEQHEVATKARITRGLRIDSYAGFK